MKKLKHKGICDEVHPELSHEEWEIEEGSKEKELDELLDFDGAIMNSKIPNNAPVATMLSKSTSDEVEKASQGSGGYFGSFYKMGEWNGKLSNGNDAPIGAYVYEINFKKLKDSENEILNGTITLIR